MPTVFSPNNSWTSARIKILVGLQENIYNSLQNNPLTRGIKIQDTLPQREKVMSEYRNLMNHIDEIIKMEAELL